MSGTGRELDYTFHGRVAKQGSWHKLLAGKTNDMVLLYFLFSVLEIPIVSSIGIPSCFNLK